MKELDKKLEALANAMGNAYSQLEETRKNIKFGMVGLINTAEDVKDLNIILDAMREAGETDADIIREFDAQIPFMKHTGLIYIVQEGLITYDYVLGKFILYTSEDKPAVVQDEEYVIDEG